MINSHNDQLSVGLIAQLIEHCTGIIEVRVQVLFRPEFLLFYHDLAKLSLLLYFHFYSLLLELNQVLFQVLDNFLLLLVFG